MKSKTLLLMLVTIMAVLAACGNESDNGEGQDKEEELKLLEVDFQVPEKADAGESVELKAIVTYGDEKVKDADEVKFEYWEKGNEEDSTMIESNNNEDGTYTAEVSFDADGVYEMYAHTSARELHTMPKKSITVGEGATADQENQDNQSENHEHDEHNEGFGIHFMEPEDIRANQETDFMVHLQLDNEPLGNANVRYEIFNDGSEKHDWVETEETEPGEYSGSFTFSEEGIYTVITHVENDEGLHEHKEQKVEVNQ